MNVSHLYRAFSTGTNSRQLFLYDETFFNNIQKVVDDKGGDLDYYESIYLYTPEHFKTFKKTHSLSGITDVKTDRLVFDFDSTSDLETARQDAVDLIGRLMETHNSSSPIRLYYSGNI